MAAEAPLPARRIRMLPDARRAQLVTAARAIFVRDGYSALSLRAVAGACEVRLSTVQHYFDGRPALIEALVANMVDDCMAIYGRYVEADGMNGAQRLTATLGLLVSQNDDAETALLFPELWALAGRDQTAAEGLDRLYRHGWAMLGRLIAGCFPAAPHVAADAAAKLALSLADGLLVSAGSRCGRQRSTAAEREDFVAAAYALIAWRCSAE